MWHSIKEFVEDNIVYYIWDVPIRWYRSIRYWIIVCGCNPFYWKQLKYTLNQNAPWDQYYFYELQYMWLKKSIYYFENHCKYIDDAHIKYIVDKQQFAIKMLDIYLEKINLWEFVEIPNADTTLPWYQTHEYKCIPYVNLRNKHRFKYLAVNFENPTNIQFIDAMYEKEQHELYKRKALNIYNKIITKYADSWWD